MGLRNLCNAIIYGHAGKETAHPVTGVCGGCNLHVLSGKENEGLPQICDIFSMGLRPFPQKRVKAIVNGSFAMAFVGAGGVTRLHLRDAQIKDRLGQALAGSVHPDCI